MDTSASGESAAFGDQLRFRGASLVCCRYWRLYVGDLALELEGRILDVVAQARTLDARELRHGAVPGQG